MKLKYGSAYTDNNDIDNTLSYPIDAERSVESRKFIEIVEARVDEIIENVWCQVPSDFADKLLGGVIITGGGCNMKNIERAFRNYTHMEKIRVAKFVTQTINSNNSEITARNGMMNTVLGLLAKGETNCAGLEINQNRDIFGEPKPQPGGMTTADLHQNPRTPSEIDGKGVVLTAAEKEAERRRKEEEERRRKEEEEKAQQEEEERRKNSMWSKMVRGFKNFGKKMMEEDE